MADCDREVERINTTAPGQESRRLLATELTARGVDNWGQSEPVGKKLRLPQFSGLEPLLWPIKEQFGVGLVAGLFPANGNGSVNGSARGILRFELIDGVIRKIGMDGNVIDEVLVDQPVVPPLFETLTLREQSLKEQDERATEIARHADDSRAREAERQRLNDITRSFFGSSKASADDGKVPRPDRAADHDAGRQDRDHVVARERAAAREFHFATDTGRFQCL